MEEVTISSSEDKKEKEEEEETQEEKKKSITTELLERSDDVFVDDVFVDTNDHDTCITLSNIRTSQHHEHGDVDIEERPNREPTGNEHVTLRINAQEKLNWKIGVALLACCWLSLLIVAIVQGKQGKEDLGFFYGIASMIFFLNLYVGYGAVISFRRVFILRFGEGLDAGVWYHDSVWKSTKLKHVPWDDVEMIHMFNLLPSNHRSNGSDGDYDESDIIIRRVRITFSDAERSCSDSPALLFLTVSRSKLMTRVLEDANRVRQLMLWYFPDKLEEETHRQSSGEVK